VSADLPPPWWPHRGHSRHQQIGPLRWHWQQWPAAGTSAEHPPRRVLLLHGTGASAHSWRELAPLLAAEGSGAEVLAPDLPGHGFTLTPVAHDVSLPGVASALQTWLDTLAWRPDVIVGHSAGAAVAAQCVLQSSVARRPAALVSINGAWLPLRGAAGQWFMPLARLLSASPLAAPSFAVWAALPGQVRRLLRSTGSRIDVLGERCYRHLVTDRRHVAGVLGLMASWDLTALQRRLPALDLPVWLLAGMNDRTLPPEESCRVVSVLPRAQCHHLPGLGHLAHEEDARAVLAYCLKAAAAAAARPLAAPSALGRAA
jgi:magnesium chelatase accessory protein